MPASSFTRKRLRVTFTMNNNAVFEGTNSNVLQIEGLRCIANIKSAGAGIAPSLALQVFGMKQTDMNALTFLAWRPLALTRNTVRVEADNGDGYVNVFFGDIIECGPDYSAAPDALLRLQSVSYYVDTLKVSKPTVYVGATDVVTIVKGIANTLGKTFEDNEVKVVLSDPYLPNTLVEQLKNVCNQAGVDLYLDVDTIAITPRGQPRKGEQVLISPATGLVMTPTVTVQGIELLSMFNPGFRFGCRVKVDVGPSCPGANGEWAVNALDHNLESEKPGGAWQSYLSCSPFERGFVIPTGNANG